MKKAKIFIDNVEDDLHHYTGLSRKIQFLKDSLQEEEETLKMNTNKLEKIEDEILLKESIKLKLEKKQASIDQETEVLQSTINEMNEERYNLHFQMKVDHSKHIISMNTKKKQVETGHEKLKLYKNFTGIRWNYALKGKSITGVITNKRDYLENFDYPLDTDNIETKLWEKIYKSVKHHIPDKKTNTENKHENK